MKVLEDGSYVFEADSRLRVLAEGKNALKVSEEDFCEALKGYKLDEFLLLLADLSVMIFDRKFTENLIWKKERDGYIIHKTSNQIVSNFAIEYIANILLISGSNNFKRESITKKDNIIFVFSIYNNFIISPTEVINPSELMIPMFYQQIVSQYDVMNTFVRQWLLFQEAQYQIKDNDRLNLDEILLKERGLTIIEYVKLCFLILAAILKNPRFKFETFAESTISGIDDVLNTEKIEAILKLLSVTKIDFIDLDNKYNPQLNPKHTKSRYNPLWEKPIIKLSSNEYVVPSVSAYMKGAFKGLYWVFENSIGKKFRDYFGSLFQNYCGMVIRDIFGEDSVRHGIWFGKENHEFFDWIVDCDNENLFFECKAYQFPLKTLQTGSPELIEKEISVKLVSTITQIYLRFCEINKYEELKEFIDKNITIVVVFYDIPLVSTELFNTDIKLQLNGLERKYPGIKDFDYIFLSIDELENYAYVKNFISINDLVVRVKKNPSSGVLNEINMVMKENNVSTKDCPKILDKKFVEFHTKIFSIVDEKIN